MRRTYALLHLILTLVIAPFTLQALAYVSGTSAHQVAGLLEVYPIMLLFGIGFSLPTLLIYVVGFHFLSKQDINSWLSKFSLIVISVLGIFVTQILIKGSMRNEIIIAFSITATIVGLVLRLKEAKLKKQVNDIAT